MPFPEFGELPGASLSWKDANSAYDQPIAPKLVSQKLPKPLEFLGERWNSGPRARDHYGAARGGQLSG
jgi:hypothetical protein